MSRIAKRPIISWITPTKIRLFDKIWVVLDEEE